MNNYLVTYRDDKFWNFSWFTSEEEVNDWLEEHKDEYFDIEAIELRHIRTIYSSL